MYIGNKQESFYILYKATLQCTHEGIRLCSKGNEMGGAGVWLSNKASHCESAEVKNESHKRRSGSLCECNSPTVVLITHKDIPWDPGVC